MPNIMYHKMKNNTSKQPFTNIPIPTNKANSFGQLVKEGIAFGTGTSIARNITDSVFHSVSSSSTEPPQISAQPQPSIVVSKTDNNNYCDFLKEQWIHCMHNSNNTSDEIDKCEYLKKMHNSLCYANTM
jgi:hypothetical protein